MATIKPGTTAWEAAAARNNATMYTYTGDAKFAPAPAPTPTPTPTATAAATPAPSGPSAEDLYWEQQRAYAAAAKKAQEDMVIGIVQGLFESYGLSSLYPKIVDYARKGYNGDAIAVMLRNEPEYKARFPAMEALNKKGRSISEADYIGYEKTAAALEQRYGLAEGMIGGAVTDLLTNEVSVSELNDRIVLASADSLNAPEDLKKQLRDYYGLDPETALRSYYLDPDKALPLLEKQSATARIGVWATRQGVPGIAKDLAGELQEQGVTEQQAEQGFGIVKGQQGFTSGRGEITDTTGLTRGTFGNETEAQKTERIAKSRAGRFAGGGGFQSGSGGVSGLGSS
jgi:hypothetical protein